MAGLACEAPLHVAMRSDGCNVPNVPMSRLKPKLEAVDPLAYHWNASHRNVSSTYLQYGGIFQVSTRDPYVLFFKKYSYCSARVRIISAYRGPLLAVREEHFSSANGAGPTQRSQQSDVRYNVDNKPSRVLCGIASSIRTVH